ncbi:MAG: AraC family transcriptional regulator [Pseudomonadota bacterium]
MTELIAPETLPVFVPGRILLDSGGLGWNGVALRKYAYYGQDVEIPGLRDYMLVSYQQGVTPMQRTFGGRWTQTTCGPGAVSLLTRSQVSHWHWTEDVEVTHVYLTQKFVSDIASDVSGRTADTVDLADVLRTDDAVMTMAINTIAAEARGAGLGNELYVEAVARQLVIHLLREYADVRFRQTARPGNLSQAQLDHIVGFIEANLHATLDLDTIAAEVNMGTSTFTRYFRRTTGTTPYAFVLERRLDRARHLLAETQTPTKQVAAQCGFCDQAHLTRLFSRRYKTTPMAYRNAVLEHG